VIKELRKNEKIIMEKLLRERKKVKNEEKKEEIK